MTDSTEPFGKIRKAPGDIAADRRCLRCAATFWSDGFGQRICPRCKGTASWRSDIPGGNGEGRRRGGGRSS